MSQHASPAASDFVGRFQAHSEPSLGSFRCWPGTAVHVQRRQLPFNPAKAEHRLRKDASSTSRPHSGRNKKVFYQILQWRAGWSSHPSIIGAATQSLATMAARVGASCTQGAPMSRVLLLSIRTLASSAPSIKKKHSASQAARVTSLVGTAQQVSTSRGPIGNGGSDK